jgi:hypothetical protein
MTDRHAATLLAVLAIASFMAAAPGESAVITNSGSTNSVGYVIKVSPDGQATLEMQGKGGTPSAPKSFTVPAATATRFFSDLAAARKANAVTVPCMKSVSFGTTTRITWQGWQSPDLDCPPKDDLGTALVNDVDAIRKASGIAAFPLRQP